jgi:hypothetical protein
MVKAAEDDDRSMRAAFTGGRSISRRAARHFGEKARPTGVRRTGGAPGDCSRRHTVGRAPARTRMRDAPRALQNRRTSSRISGRTGDSG